MFAGSQPSLGRLADHGHLRVTIGWTERSQASGDDTLTPRGCRGAAGGAQSIRAAYLVDDRHSVLTMKKASLAEKFAAIHEHWRPKVVAELNGQEDLLQSP
jgi:hypothetical protein